jgi:hypothetical protein
MSNTKTNSIVPVVVNISNTRYVFSIHDTFHMSVFVPVDLLDHLRLETLRPFVSAPFSLAFFAISSLPALPYISITLQNLLKPS